MQQPGPTVRKGGHSPWPLPWREVVMKTLGNRGLRRCSGILSENPCHSVVGFRGLAALSVEASSSASAAPTTSTSPTNLAGDHDARPHPLRHHGLGRRQRYFRPKHRPELDAVGQSRHNVRPQPGAPGAVAGRARYLQHAEPGQHVDHLEHHQPGVLLGRRRSVRARVAVVLRVRLVHPARPGARTTTAPSPRPRTPCSISTRPSWACTSTSACRRTSPSPLRGWPRSVRRPWAATQPGRPTSR